MSHIQSGYFIRLSQPLVGQDAMSSLIKEVPYHVSYLTHISLAFFLWDIGKQCRPRPDAEYAASDQGPYCSLKDFSIKIKKTDTDCSKLHSANLNGLRHSAYCFEGLPLRKGQKLMSSPKRLFLRLLGWQNEKYFWSI